MEGVHIGLSSHLGSLSRLCMPSCHARAKSFHANFRVRACAIVVLATTAYKDTLCCAACVTVDCTPTVSEEFSYALQCCK